MENIKANYIDFKNRLFISSGLYLGLIMFAILEFVILSNSGSLSGYSLILQSFLVLILVLFFSICYNKSKYYIEKIELKEMTFLLDVYMFDNKLDRVEIPYSDLLLKLKKNLAERYPRYTLEFRSSASPSQAHNHFYLKQYELGYWDKKNLKNAYKLLSEKLHN